MDGFPCMFWVMDLLFLVFKPIIFHVSFMLTALFVSSSFLLPMDLIMQKKPLPEFWRAHYIVSALYEIMHVKILYKCSLTILASIIILFIYLLSSAHKMS